MPTKQQIEDILKTIPDPEIGISIYDLGLIYDITIDEEQHIVHITMTLTTIGCPLFHLIAEPIKEKVNGLEGVSDVIVELTFDPPWNPDKMKQEAKEQLGLA
ncbi:MAG: metal-sulfur cluster assembly factor [Patescibacteria group bacterium]|nr:metal-sulfur cluster assembly factor [Patescibacteria group bacterium]